MILDKWMGDWFGGYKLHIMLAILAYLPICWVCTYRIILSWKCKKKKNIFCPTLWTTLTSSSQLTIHYLCKITWSSRKKLHLNVEYLTPLLMTRLHQSSSLLHVWAMKGKGKCTCTSVKLHQWIRIHIALGEWMTNIKWIANLLAMSANIRRTNDKINGVNDDNIT